jgi:hypothetical protein
MSFTTHAHQGALMADLQRVLAHAEALRVGVLIGPS